MHWSVYFLVGVVLFVLVLAWIAPKTYAVSRSVLINQDRKTVFPYLQFLEKRKTWSPWAKKDPDMEMRLIGNDGEVGVVSYWNGNKDVGEGEEEITKIVPNERVETHIRFMRPWKSESDAFISAKDAANNATEVSWGFSGKNKFPTSIMMLFMNMDKMVGKDFEEGLQNLKRELEK